MAIKNARRPGYPGWPEKPISELQTYKIRADRINYDTSTGELELFSLPAGTLVVSLEWQTVAAWADSEMSNPMILLGDTSNYRKYGVLGQAQLGSTGNGKIDVNFDSTGESKIVAYIVTQGAKPVAPAAGNLDIWLTYRPFSESQSWVNST